MVRTLQPTKSDSCFPFFCDVSNFFMGLKSSSRIFRAVFFGGLVRRDTVLSGSVRFRLFYDGPVAEGGRGDDSRGGFTACLFFACMLCNVFTS